ncbi:MAG: hypothetical protein RL757_983 [Bacteroidota bacterium]|jgi:UDP-N-acetylmuramate--alanine ligase
MQDQISLQDIRTIYFVGIGGIGMSALARYFLLRGCDVHGYDRTETELTRTLAQEGMKIHYTDDIKFIPSTVDLVVFTPAIPKNHSELLYFQEHNFPILKRSEVLGIISRGMRCIGVAGTHGKTSTSSIVTHVLRTGGIDATAFLGGISLSLGSNFVEGKSDWVVVEADEFDRSFLRLSPDIAIVTAIDPDHLDIYGDEENFRKGFQDYAARLKNGGKLLKNIELKDFEAAERELQRDISWTTYGTNGGAFQAYNIRVENGFFVFDYKSPLGNMKNVLFTLAGRHNIENAVAAMAVAQLLGVKTPKIKQALASFKGIKRRFERIFQSEKYVFIDDYAHHPTELENAIAAAKMLFPNRKITGIFQPHLFSRTNDFQDGFATALDELDEIVLLDIYPARELPMAGVTSKIVFDKMKNPNKTLTDKQNLMDILGGRLSELDVVLTLGAGDIDTFVPKIKSVLEKYNS